MNKSKKEKDVKLIDQLSDALTKAGIAFDRDGWEENKHSDPPNDHCEWINVHLLTERGNKIIVNFYFTQNATMLSDMDVLFSKKITGFTEPTIIATALS